MQADAASFNEVVLQMQVVFVSEQVELYTMASTMHVSYNDDDLD